MKRVCIDIYTREDNFIQMTNKGNPNQFLCVENVNF